MNKSRSLRVYFALLFALVVGGSFAVAVYVNDESSKQPTGA
jgi:membrane protein required for beta-lactamase induction